MARLWLLVNKRALLVTASCLVGWRLLNQIPVIDVTHGFIAHRLAQYEVPLAYPAIDSHSVAFESYSLGYYGITPYVQVLFLTSLAILLSGRLRFLVNSYVGRRRLERWLRVAAVLWALGAGYSWTSLAQNAGAIPQGIDWFVRLAISLEMAGGTAVMILLASALDEYGLGFGYGAIIFYALDIFADGIHRVADYIAYAPSLEALYRPLAVWAGFSLAITAAGVAIFLAYCRAWTRNDSDDEPTPVDLKLVMPGILRPGLMAFGLLNLPFVLESYAGSNPSPLRWFLDNWGPSGSVAWLDIIYIVAEAALLIFFAMAVVVIDWMVTDLPWDLEFNGVRLAAISGVAFALLIAVARPLAHFATQAAGQLIAVSGFNVLLVTAMVLLVVLGIERSRHPFVTTEAQLP